ncbi:uncharacterized protein ARMOST_02177 [Armillaria ostoyae]|uniref:Uncharacterized protein n=1 Tax=Armillaria ostoyae TaxID=47428 RepID=A0A284QR70_ARMOS|nr:uncharacterized protein ARMOST_02177 [Armillaria ostoyae]
MNLTHDGTYRNGIALPRRQYLSPCLGFARYCRVKIAITLLFSPRLVLERHHEAKKLLVEEPGARLINLDCTSFKGTLELAQPRDTSTRALRYLDINDLSNNAFLFNAIRSLQSAAQGTARAYFSCSRLLVVPASSGSGEVKISFPPVNSTAHILPWWTKDTSFIRYPWLRATVVS